MLLLLATPLCKRNQHFKSFFLYNRIFCLSTFPKIIKLLWINHLTCADIVKGLRLCLWELLHSLINNIDCHNSHKQSQSPQKIIDLTEMENFAKESRLAKLLQEMKLCFTIKKSTAFSSMFLTASWLCFGCFAVGQHVNVCVLLT